MAARFLPLLFFSVCCAALFAAADIARGQMTIRDVPLNHTAAWGKHLALLRESPPPATVPPLPIPGPGGAAVYAGRASSFAGNIPQEWQGLISKASARHGVPEALLAAVLKAESDFNPYSTSPKGAKGAMQIMPATGKALGLQDFFDPEANLDAGAAYLAALMREFSYPELALAAYNAGPEAIRRHGGVPPYEETRAYVARVLALFTQYSLRPR